MRVTIIAALIACVSTASHAECVTVKYRDGACVPLEKLDCKSTVSSFINKLCYDEKNGYMLLLLKETWYITTATYRRTKWTDF